MQAGGTKKILKIAVIKEMEIERENCDLKGWDIAFENI